MVGDDVEGQARRRLGQWWDGIGGLVFERTRSVAAAPNDVDRLCDV